MSRHIREACRCAHELESALRIHGSSARRILATDLAFASKYKNGRKTEHFFPSAAFVAGTEVVADLPESWACRERNEAAISLLPNPVLPSWPMDEKGASLLQRMLSWATQCGGTLSESALDAISAITERLIHAQQRGNYDGLVASLRDVYKTTGSLVLATAQARVTAAGTTQNMAPSTIEYEYVYLLASNIPVPQDLPIREIQNFAQGLNVLSFVEGNQGKTFQAQEKA